MLAVRFLKVQTQRLIDGQKHDTMINQCYQKSIDHSISQGYLSLN